MSIDPILPPVRVVFARRLKALRIPRGYATARSFAVALEIDENRYTRYERAEVEPDLSLLVRICVLLGVTPSDLLDVPGQIAGAGGFAEGAVAPLANAGANGSSNTTRRRALAWQVAEEIAKLDLSPPGHALENVGRVSRLFAEITADPFSFVTRMTAERRFESLDQGRATRLGHMIDELIAATKEDVLGRREDLPASTAGDRHG
jgi:transcriptional regulator with XRE-family HTH domain